MAAFGVLEPDIMLDMYVDVSRTVKEGYGSKDRSNNNEWEGVNCKLMVGNQIRLSIAFIFTA